MPLIDKKAMKGVTWRKDALSIDWADMALVDGTRELSLRVYSWSAPDFPLVDSKLGYLRDGKVLSTTDLTRQFGDVTGAN